MNEDDEEKKEPINWKKTGFGFKEHLTLKHNTLEAQQYRSQKGRHHFSMIKKMRLKVVDPNKIRAKIKEAFDDEEDEDENGTYMPIHQRHAEDNMLYNALNEDEKRHFMQKSVIKETRMQQDVGKMEALHIANNLARSVGMKKISEKAVAKGMQQATFDPKGIQKEVIRKEVSKKFGIKGNIPNNKIKQVARGIKRIEEMGGRKATKNLDMKDVARAGEDKMDNKKLAELIMEKSGKEIPKEKQFKSAKDIKVDPLENSGKTEKIKALKRRKEDLSR